MQRSDGWIASRSLDWALLTRRRAKRPHLCSQGIADVVETLLEDVDSYLDEAAGKGANRQVLRDEMHKIVASHHRAMLLCGVPSGNREPLL